MSENVAESRADSPRNRSPVRSPSTRPPAAPPAAPRRVVLLLSSCLAVLGAVLLAPVLPRIEDAFAGTAGVEALTPIVLTAPALVIGLTATFAGRVVDRLGRKRLLVAALVVYAFVGTAPLWLPSLQLIVVSRVLVGLTEAAIMTCCTTLLADYFHGSQRERYFGLQVVCTTVAATIFFGVGGALGAHELADAVLALRRSACRWPSPPPASSGSRRRRHRRPRAPEARPAAVAAAGRPGRRHAARRPGLLRADRRAVVQARRHRRGRPPPPSARSARSPRWAPRSAPSSSAGWPRPRPGRHRAAGLRAVRHRADRPRARLRRAGGGRLRGGHRASATACCCPSLLTWALGSLTFEQRGRGTGVWTSAVFIGQFVCPLRGARAHRRVRQPGYRASWSWASWPWPRPPASGWRVRRRRPTPRSPLPERRRRPATTAGPSGPPHLIPGAPMTAVPVGVVPPA